jgi:ubiquinone/menaquinone biosynthesis C-methylase UbiE
VQKAEYARMREQEDHYWLFVSRRRLAPALLSRFSSPGLTLDVGCGTGAVLTELQARGEAVGIDLSGTALEYAAERGLTNLVKADAQALPFSSAAFQSVVSLDTLEHVPDDKAAAREIARVLKPGGVAVINVPAFRWLWGPHDVALMHCRRYTRGELKKLLEDAGLQVVKASYGVFFLFPVVLIIRLADRLGRRKPEVVLPPVPGWFNRFLTALMSLEEMAIPSLGLPWGSSVVAIARKPK